MNVTIISGSPRQQSVSVRVAQHLYQYLQIEFPANDFALLDLREHVLPFVDEVWKNIDQVPGEHKELAERIFRTDVFVLVTPEYNGSYSPALKNLLDHFPKQKGKVFGVVTASDGAMGGMRASQQMQLLVAALFGFLSPTMLIVPFMDKKFSAQGELVEAGFEPKIKLFGEDLFHLAGLVHTSKEA